MHAIIFFFVFIEAKTHELLVYDILLLSIFWAAVVSQKGSDAWWYMKVEELLPDKYRDKASDYDKGTDTMDVWFDSGIMTIIMPKLVSENIN